MAAPYTGLRLVRWQTTAVIEQASAQRKWLHWRYPQPINIKGMDAYIRQTRDRFDLLDRTNDNAPYSTEWRRLQPVAAAAAGKTLPDNSHAAKLKSIRRPVAECSTHFANNNIRLCAADPQQQWQHP